MNIAKHISTLLLPLIYWISTAQYAYADSVPYVEPSLTATPIENSVIPDSKPPASRIEIGSPRYTNETGKVFVSSESLFSIFAEDNSSGVAQSEYRINKGAWRQYREPFKIDDEGDHTIEFRSIDNRGNIEEAKKVQVTIDSTPPISILTPDGSRKDSADIYYISNPLKFTLTATDRHAGVKGSEYRVDRSEWREYAPFIVDDSKKHLISYRSTDNLGNSEAPKSVEVHIDTTPPVTTIDTGSPKLDSSKGIQIIHDSTFFTLTAKDTQSGPASTEYRIDGGGWIRYEPFTIQTGGQHTIEYRSTDKAGNIEIARSRTFIVDTAPPVTRIRINDKEPEPGVTYISAIPLKINLSASDINSGVRQIEYKLDGGQWTEYQPFTVASEGVHLIEFRSIDQFYNVEPTRFVKAIIDNTPPNTSLLIGEPKQDKEGIISISDKTVLSLSASDELSGIASSEYLITGRGERRGVEPFSIATQGEYDIRFWSTDRTGNRESEKNVKVKVIIPPQAPIEALIPILGKLREPAPGIIDTEIPDSIRLPTALQTTAPKTAITETQTQTNASAFKENIDNELMYIADLTSGITMKSLENERVNPKEYFGVGGINALIIAIIFLVL